MVKNVLTGFILLLATINLNATEILQKEGFDFDTFKAEKIAYFTDIIDLTANEAQVFWPVYNEYEKMKWELVKERREIDDSLKEFLTKMNDEEFIELSKKIASFHSKEGKLDEEYNEKFLKILPPEKVIKLYMAELHFRNNMLRKYRRGNRD
jgi:hypothetical protein